MMMNLRVYNLVTEKPPSDSVFIGRPSKWGNPFIIGVDGTRIEVIQKYKKYLYENPSLLKDVMIELRGKSLHCFCSPKRCHGDVLIKIANEHTLWD